MFYNNLKKNQKINYEFNYLELNKIQNINYQNLILNIKNYNTYSLFLYRTTLKLFLNTFLKIKLKFYSKKNKKIIFLKNYNNSLVVLKTKYFKLKKKIVSKPLSSVLRNRKLLKHFFNVFKIKSWKLTSRLLNIYKWYSLYYLKCNLVLGFILLNSGLCLNISDLYYFLKSNLVKINNKVVNSFYYYLNVNDVISFNNIMYIDKYNNFFKKFNYKWFKRKKRKNISILKKYLNFNKTSIKITKLLKRWFSNFSFNSFSNKAFEIDYRIGIVFVFNSYFTKNNSSFSNIFFNNFMIFNLWYYKF